MNVITTHQIPVDATGTIQWHDGCITCLIERRAAVTRALARCGAGYPDSAYLFRSTRYRGLAGYVNQAAARIATAV